MSELLLLINKAASQKKIYKVPFQSEKDLCNYIDQSAVLFAESVLGIKYKSHQREYYLGKPFRCNQNNGSLPHTDFIFTSRSGENILVECKFPLSPFAALNAAIGQVLAYKLVARENGVEFSRLCIVSTADHDVFIDLIREFNIPIEFYLANADCFMRLI